MEGDSNSGGFQKQNIGGFRLQQIADQNVMSIIGPLI